MMVSRSLTEQLSISETVVATISAVTMAESIAVSDTVSVAVSRAATDQLGMTESIRISVSRSIVDQLAVADSIVAVTTGEALVTDQLGATEFITIMVSKQVADNLALSDAIVTTGSTGMTEPMAVIDTVSRSAIITRAIIDSFAVTDTVSSSPVVVVLITESMAINDYFTDISIVFNLNLGETLIMAQSFATNFSAFFNQPESEGIIIGDSVVLSLGQVLDRNIMESMGIQDSLVNAGAAGGGSGSRSTEFTRSLAESMLVSSVAESMLVSSPANLDLSIESEGKLVIKNLADSLKVTATQGQPLHQRFITIQNVSVAVNVADVKSAGLLGAAVATLNFEITNENGAEEEIVLRYWYSDPESGTLLYEGNQTVTVGAGQSLTYTVDIPFYSEGISDIMIEAKSGDGTIASTDIAVSVPWLTVYLYVLVAVAAAVVLISISYVIFAIRRPRSPDIKGS
jgi:hypothetical protein